MTETKHTHVVINENTGEVVWRGSSAESARLQAQLLTKRTGTEHRAAEAEE